jgi:hypothetical protein
VTIDATVTSTWQMPIQDSSQTNPLMATHHGTSRTTSDCFGSLQESLGFRSKSSVGKESKRANGATVLENTLKSDQLVAWAKSAETP